jgi:hypothetical protein
MEARTPQPTTDARVGVLDGRLPLQRVATAAGALLAAASHRARVPHPPPLLVHVARARRQAARVGPEFGRCAAPRARSPQRRSPGALGLGSYEAAPERTRAGACGTEWIVQSAQSSLPASLEVRSSAPASRVASQCRRAKLRRECARHVQMEDAAAFKPGTPYLIGAAFEWSGRCKPRYPLRDGRPHANSLGVVSVPTETGIDTGTRACGRRASADVSLHLGAPREYLHAGLSVHSKPEQTRNH